MKYRNTVMQEIESSPELVTNEGHCLLLVSGWMVWNSGSPINANSYITSMARSVLVTEYSRMNTHSYYQVLTISIVFLLKGNLVMLHTEVKFLSLIYSCPLNGISNYHVHYYTLFTV
jgi:hypothetical protein